MSHSTCAPFVLLLSTTIAQTPDVPVRPMPRPPQLGVADKAEGPTIPFVPRRRDHEAVSGAMPASDSTPTSDPGLSAPAGLYALDPHQVWLDRPAADGPVWACSRDWKARFDAAGFTFIPFFGAQSPRNFPSRFELVAARVAGVPLRLDASPPTMGDRQVELPRRDVVERFALAGEGVEQTFVFTDLPVRGELVLELAVTSELTPHVAGDVIEFANEFGRVTYGRATAISADGSSTPVERTFTGNSIRLTVPAAFVVGATLPLAIDPWVFGSAAALTQNEVIQCRPDIAYDTIAHQYVAVWQRQYSVQDVDVWAQRFIQNVFTGAANAVGNPIAIDYTGLYWHYPKIANVRAAQIYLVVAEVSDAYVGNPVYWIGGRTMNTGGGTSNQFDIERSGVVGYAGNNFAPQVGGDAYPTGPSYFTVVWEHEYSATDHDIYMKQVTTTATLRSTYPTVIDASGFFEDHPAISRTDGATDVATQRWFVGYQRHATSTDSDIYGAMISWDGQIVPWGTAPRFPVATGPSDDWFPRVSSPTNMQGSYRYALYAYGPSNSASGGLVVVNHYGYIEHQYGVSPVLGAAPYELVTDCDGTRFTVAWAGSASVFAATLAFLAGPAPILRLDDLGGQSPAVLNGVPLDVAITAAHGSPSPDNHGLVYGVLTGSYPTQTYGFEARFYLAETTGGGLSQRATACGSLSIAAAGVPAIGHSLTFYLGASGPLHGLLLGSPLSLPLGFCPCTLGVDGFGAADPYTIVVPGQVSLVGAVFSVQGYDFANGPCLGSISLSNTIDVTVR